MKRAFLCIALLCCSLVFGIEAAETNLIEIQTCTNTDTLYTTYWFKVPEAGKNKNEAICNDCSDCGAKISWEVIDQVGNPKPLKFICVFQSKGAGSFLANAEAHKQIMKKIFSKWPVSDFEDIDFIDCLGGPPDWSWNIPIAVASSKSDDYKDFKANYPNSRISGLFGLYRQLGDQTGVYRPIQKIFREVGVDIEFEGGDKEVLHAKAKDLPFYAQLRAQGIGGETRVIYDALGNGFTIKPWPNNPLVSGK